MQTLLFVSLTCGLSGAGTEEAADAAHHWSPLPWCAPRGVTFAQRWSCSPGSTCTGVFFTHALFVPTSQGTGPPVDLSWQVLPRGRPELRACAEYCRRMQVELSRTWSQLEHSAVARAAKDVPGQTTATPPAKHPPGAWRAVCCVAALLTHRQAQRYCRPQLPRSERCDNARAAHCLLEFRFWCAAFMLWLQHVPH